VQTATGAMTVTGNTFRDNTAKSLAAGPGSRFQWNDDHHSGNTFTGTQRRVLWRRPSRAFWNGVPRPDNNVFSGNSARHNGGGVYVQVDSANLAFITIPLPSTPLAGGRSLRVSLHVDATADIHNNILWGNTSTESDAPDLFVYDYGDGDGSTVRLHHNDFNPTLPISWTEDTSPRAATSTSLRF